MNTDISPTAHARLIQAASAEGVSVDALIERLIDEHAELSGILENAEANLPPMSPERIQAQIERGFAQSERGETVDGEIFTSGLLAE